MKSKNTPAKLSTLLVHIYINVGFQVNGLFEIKNILIFFLKMELTTEQLQKNYAFCENQISSTTMHSQQTSNNISSENILIAKIAEMNASLCEKIENQKTEINTISENQSRYFNMLNKKIEEQGDMLEKKLNSFERKLSKQVKVMAKCNKKLKEIRVLCKKSIEQLLHQVERKVFDIRMSLRKDLIKELKTLKYRQVFDPCISSTTQSVPFCSNIKNTIMKCPHILSASSTSLHQQSLPFYGGIHAVDCNTPFHEEMSSPSAGKRRMDNDVIKLIESKHEVTILGGLNEFHVKFFGPHGTPYEGGVWKVRVYLPDNYPFKSPSIGFVNKIYHPNIDESSGTVCLDVINQAWTALYDLSNIFESFLPQLLTYPNPVDPLNRDAAALYLHEPEEYKKKVADYVQRFATEEALRAQQERESSDSESSMSDFSEDEARDMEL